MSETINIKEVHEKLDALAALMSDKGCVEPRTGVRIGSGSQIYIWMMNSTEGAQVGTYQTHYERAKTVSEALTKAETHIRAMPDPEDAALQRHVERLAEVADKARDDNIPDEYIAPIPKIIKAISDNLLEAPEAAK